VSQSKVKVRPHAGVSSHPADVLNIWQDYLPNPFSWANSLLVHLIAVSALLLPFALKPVTGRVPVSRIRDYYGPVMLMFPQLHGHADKTGGGGGGGDGSKLPASRGAIPQFSLTQFAPPAAVIPNLDPVLPVNPTLIGPPELKLPAMAENSVWGDPNGVLGPLSNGRGKYGGIGDGEGPGVGPGKGPGYGPGSDGGCCGGIFTVGNGVTAPVPIYKPEPAYSEEARKAKFGGTLTLWIVVDPQGNVRDVQLVKPLGMGLDEEAMKTVRTWKFKPGLRQHVPVAVRVMVEVSFRLF
jgi:TonB family protein